MSLKCKKEKEAEVEHDYTHTTAAGHSGIVEKGIEMEKVAFTKQIQSTGLLYSTSSSQSAGLTALGSAIKSSVTQSEEQKERKQHRVIRRGEEVEEIQSKTCLV